MLGNCSWLSLNAHYRVVVLEQSQSEKIKKIKKNQVPARFELTISCLLDRRFNQLSHGTLVIIHETRCIILTFSSLSNELQSDLKTYKKYTIGYLDYYERCTVVSVWWVLKNCLWFCITKVALSALLCKCSKNVNFSWKTNKRCYKHDKCLHCKGNFFCKFSWPLASKQICRCIQKMYFCLRPRLKYTTVDVVFVLFKLFLWPFLPKKDHSLHAKLLLHTVTKISLFVLLNFLA